MVTTPPELDEERIIRDEINQITLPEGLRFDHIEQSHEWTGEPALRIYFKISIREPLTQHRLDEVARVDRELFAKITALKLEKWPLFEMLEEV